METTRVILSKIGDDRRLREDRKRVDENCIQSVGRRPLFMHSTEPHQKTSLPPDWRPERGSETRRIESKSLEFWQLIHKQSLSNSTASHRAPVLDLGPMHNVNGYKKTYYPPPPAQLFLIKWLQTGNTDEVVLICRGESENFSITLYPDEMIILGQAVTNARYSKVERDRT